MKRKLTTLASLLAVALALAGCRNPTNSECDSLSGAECDAGAGGGDGGGGGAGIDSGHPEDGGVDSGTPETCQPDAAFSTRDAGLLAVMNCPSIAACATNASESFSCRGQGDCDTNARCINQSGAYHCVCRPGFRGDGKSCTDVNECADGTDRCDAGIACSNTVGSYSCNLPIFNPALDAGQRIHRVPATIDAVAEAPFGEVGRSVVVNSPIGAYREVGKGAHDRMAYLFNGVAPVELLRLTVRHPDDKPRIGEVMVYVGGYGNGNSAYWGTFHALGTAHITGFSHPISNQMLEQTYYFYVPYRTDSFAIDIITTKHASVSQPDGGLGMNPAVAARAPAAVAMLKVERVATDETPHWPSEMDEPNRRKIGLFWEDPTLSPLFSGIIVPPDGSISPNLGRFNESVDRHVEYSQRIGHRSIVYPVVWYRGAIFQPSPEYSNISFRYHSADFDKLMARRYSREGIDFWPSIKTWNLPTLRPHIAQPEDIRDGGVSSYVNAVYANGDIAHDLVVGANNPLYHGRPPVVNALHPVVRAAQKALITDIMNRIGQEPSVKGIFLWFDLPTMFGVGQAANSGYDDYSVSLFSTETGIPLPPKPANPAQRFTQWHQWLRNNHWSRWLEWRKKKQTDYLIELAELIDSKKRGAKLRIMPRDPLATSSSANDVEAYLHEWALDVATLAKHPSIDITPHFRAYEYEAAVRGTDEASAQTIALEARSKRQFDATWQRPFVGNSVGTTVMWSFFEWYSFRDEHPECANDRDLDQCYSHIWFPPTWRQESSFFLTVTAPHRPGTLGLEYLAQSVALFDSKTMTHGGYNLGAQGIEEPLQRFSASYGSLPAVPFETIAERDGVLLRSTVHGGFRWYYLLNATDRLKQVSLAFPFTGSVTRLGLDKANISISKDAPQVVALEPFDLAAWKVELRCGLTP